MERTVDDTDQIEEREVFGKLDDRPFGRGNPDAIGEAAVADGDSRAANVDTTAIEMNPIGIGAGDDW